MPAGQREGTAPFARALRPASTIPGRLEALMAREELRRQADKGDERARTEKDTLARYDREFLQEDPSLAGLRGASLASGEIGAKSTCPKGSRALAIDKLPKGDLYY